MLFELYLWMTKSRKGKASHSSIAENLSKMINMTNLEERLKIIREFLDKRK